MELLILIHLFYTTSSHTGICSGLGPGPFPWSTKMEMTGPSSWVMTMSHLFPTTSSSGEACDNCPQSSSTSNLRGELQAEWPAWRSIGTLSTQRQSQRRVRTWRYPWCFKGRILAELGSIWAIPSPGPWGSMGRAESLNIEPCQGMGYSLAQHTLESHSLGIWPAGSVPSARLDIVRYGYNGYP